MAARTRGEKWIRLLRAYGHVADNEAMQAEHVDKLAHSRGIPKLAFEHPAAGLRLDCCRLASGALRLSGLPGTTGLCLTAWPGN